MNSGRSHRIAGWAGIVVLGTLLTVACDSGAGEGTDAPSGSASSSPPHGYVEGAEEAAEQQSRLVLADSGTGAVRVLDLTTEKTASPKQVKGVNAVRTDGRYAYLTTATGTRVLDSGAWTVEHGDHVHYYRAKIKHVGALDGTTPAQVHGDAALTAVTQDDGTAQLYQRADLDDGQTGTPRKVPTQKGAGAVLPYREHLLRPVTADGRTTVEVRARDGEEVATLREDCPRPSGEAVTRRGVVFGCADGALLVTEKDGTFKAVKIPYGQSVDEGSAATEFRHRPGSTTLTASAGSKGTWVLDVTSREWTLVSTGPTQAVNTAGEGAPLLALTADGMLSAYDIETGQRTARTKLLSSASEDSASGSGAKDDQKANVRAPVIEVDTSRAYVNDPAAKKVHEIDYNDDLRTARTFSLDITPTHMVETGR